MDRAGLNLEALTEEEDEQSWERSDSDSEDDEGRGGEPNQFDNLCDGVHACMALVHASLHEMLELKDELLRHTLPPSVLTKTALVTSKVFRSFSDMHTPVGELIRMVRLYSTPWEEKSTALKKLHDDYEGKKTQLNIAIKRLEMTDAHSKRIARERRVMNWEKLFAKMTAAKGHGRRWKFLIDAFKKRANLGMEQLQQYLDSIDISSSEDEGDEEEEEEEEEEVATQMQHVGFASPSIQQEEDDDEEEEDPPSSDSESESEAGSKDIKDSVSEIESAPTQKEEEVKKVVQIKPPTKDSETYDEVEFDRQLYVRVYSPDGLDCKELKCVLNLGDSMIKTGVLDMHHDQEKEAEPAPIKEAPSRTPTTPRRGRGARSLIPGRGGRSTVSPSRTPTLQMAPLPENEEENQEETKDTRYYEDCIFDLEEETPGNHYVPPGSQRVKWPEHLRVAVHFGPRDEIVSMATIHMEDIKRMELPTLVLPPPIGDEFDTERAIIEGMERAEKEAKASNMENVISEVERANTRVSDTQPDEAAEEAQADEEVQNALAEEKQEEEAKPVKKPKDPVIEKALKEVAGDKRPVDFPLYSIHSGRSDAVHMPIGQLPLLCFWVKRQRPVQLSKMTESESVRALVMDLTGIDLNVTTKEDLNKEMTDEALSTISFTPEPKEQDIVSKEEYDRLMSAHNEEMEMMQSEYEQRLQELMETIQQLQGAIQEAQFEMSAMEMALPPVMVAEQPSPPHHQPSQPPHQRPYSSRYDAQTSPIRSMSRSPHNTRHQVPEGVHIARPASHKQTTTSDIDQYYDGIYHEKMATQKVGKPLPKWGKGLSDDFFERLQHFNELSAQKKAELREQLVNQMRSDIEKKMASQYRLASQHEEGVFDAIQDVSLPAVFLPSKSNNMHIYNPRANKYFHPTGAGGARLSQPPSIIQLPPLPKSKISILNLFDVSQNFHRGGPDWLMQRYLSASNAEQQEKAPSRPGTTRGGSAVGKDRVKTPTEKDPTPQPKTDGMDGQKQPSPEQLKPQQGSPSQQSAQGQVQEQRPPGSGQSRQSQIPSQQATRAPSVKSGRASNSGSNKARSVASFRQEQLSQNSVRHQVTLPGGAGGATPVRSPGGSNRPSVMSAALDQNLAKSVSPLDYMPPRTGTMTSTPGVPGMLKTPAPVGAQEVGLIAPQPPQPLHEVPTPTF